MQASDSSPIHCFISSHHASISKKNDSGVFCINALSLAYVTRCIPDIDTTLGERFDCLTPGVITKWGKDQAATMRGAIEDILGSVA